MGDARQPSTRPRPQRIHGIRAAEIVHAPTFDQITGELAALLRGRVVVAHNLRFDAGFLAAEFLRCGYQVPLAVEHGLCTMGLAHRYLPGSGRSLADCCASFGVRAAALTWPLMVSSSTP
ncbi:MAG: 3'-5' exonuclease [Pseudonocardiaceae bacterium]